MLNTTLKVRDVGFSVAGLERTKFGFYRFQIFLIMVAIVISILFKTTFWQTSIQNQSVVKISKRSPEEDKITLNLRRMKNIGMVSEKLHRNNLITAYANYIKSWHTLFSSTYFSQWKQQLKKNKMMVMYTMFTSRAL